MSYSQSRINKYPKQTVISGDTVVIVSLYQANEMNERFLTLQNDLDSLNNIADTLNTAVLCEIIENDSLREEIVYSYQLINKEYKKERRNHNMKETFILIGILISFTIVGIHLNTL